MIVYEVLVSFDMFFMLPSDMVSCAYRGVCTGMPIDCAIKSFGTVNTAYVALALEMFVGCINDVVGKFP